MVVVNLNSSPFWGREHLEALYPLVEQGVILKNMDINRLVNVGLHVIVNSNRDHVYRFNVDKYRSFIPVAIPVGYPVAEMVGTQVAVLWCIGNRIICFNNSSSVRGLVGD